jgi:hypothetical protein
MNSIFSALESGYDPEEIIGYIAKAIPKMAPTILKAKKSGYSVQQILGFLSKSFDNTDRRGLSQSERHAANTRADTEMVKHGLKMGATALAAPLAAGAAGSALQRAFPAQLQGLAPGIASQMPGLSQQQPMNTAGQNTPSSAMQPPLNQAQNKVTPSSSPPIIETGNIPQTPAITQAVTPKRDINKSLDIIKSSGLETNIKNMLEGGMSPPDIAAVLPRMAGKDLAKKLGKIEGGLEGVIEDYAQSMPKPDTNMSQVQPDANLAQSEPAMQPEAPILKEEPKEKKSIEKNSVVASPQGVGEVKEIRNGQAIVDVDGKKHKVSEDELIQSPLPEKELADLYDDVIKGIEKETGQEVSRNVEWAGYDPNTNELAYKPHGSDKLYVYEDISPEDAQTLTSLLTKRKSTGSNHIGAWEANTTSPIGAAMYQLIKKLQSERGGKGNEYRGKYQTIYDAIEPAKLASKRKHAEERKKAKKPRAS